MKALLIILISIFANATCTQEQYEKANRAFYEAGQSDKPLKLLEESLKLCFTYEVEFTLLDLKAKAEPNLEKRLKLYNQALESLSLIENNDDLVRSEQSRINRVIAKFYEKDNPLVSDIYQNKAVSQNSVKQKANTPNHLPWIIVILLLSIWAFWDFIKKLGIWSLFSFFVI